MEHTRSLIEQAEAALSDAIRAAAGWDDTCEEAASHLAALLAECGASSGDIRRRLCRLGVSRDGAAELASRALDAADDRVEIPPDALYAATSPICPHCVVRADALYAGASPICPHCVEPISPQDDYCPHCHRAISGLGPVAGTRGLTVEALDFRRVLSGKPRRIVLVGVWLLLGPFALLMLGTYVKALYEFDPERWWEQSVDEDFWWSVLGQAIVFVIFLVDAAILWKVTARHVRHRRKRAQ
ncbi:MAG: hypothetical protein NT031_11025 [Planctomycetota bacterium]|nr:hypothetical protein [Planctomycetota bacterium]